MTREVAARHRSRRSHWIRAVFGVGVLLVSLLALTVWNVTRSEALADAHRSYVRGDLAACLGRALDHLARRPWSREASLLAGRCLSRLDYPDAAEPYYQRAGELSL